MCQVMEVLVTLLWHKLRGFITRNRVVVVDHWPTSLMKGEYNNFKVGYITGKYIWYYKLKQYAVGNLPARAEVMRWDKEAEVIYCPMYWQAKH